MKLLATAWTVVAAVSMVTISVGKRLQIRLRENLIVILRP